MPITRGAWLAVLVGCLLSLSATQTLAAGEAQAHVGHLLTSWQDTPGQVGLLVGLESQVQVARTHATLAADSADADSIKAHIHHALNALEGTKGPNYDKSFGDPGDGYGILAYIDGAKAHTNLAAQSADASEAVKLHSEHVLKALDNAKGWAEEAIKHAKFSLESGDATEAKLHAGHVVEWLQKADEGLDSDQDSQVSWQEGGVKTAVQHAGFMQ